MKNRIMKVRDFTPSRMSSEFAVVGIRFLIT